MSWPATNPWPQGTQLTGIVASPAIHSAVLPNVVNPTPGVLPPQAAVAPAAMPAGMQYSPEQWAQMQQQNWQQWAQWQQQYQQWHQQYGAEYQKSMSALQTPTPNTSVPPPPPSENKPPPPPPPEETQAQQYSRPPPMGYTTAPPPTLPNHYGQGGGDWQTSVPAKRPSYDNDQYGANKRQMLDNRGGNNSWQSQPPPQSQPPINVPPPAQKTANLEELSEAEKKFDKEFAAWEAQFNKWKEQNANHPDKSQYIEYEKKWESWRNSLLERREQMRKKRIALQATLNPSNPPPSNVSHNAPRPQQTSFPQSDIPKANISMQPPIAAQTEKFSENLFTKPPPTQNNEPLSFKPPVNAYSSAPETEENDAGGDGFLKSSSPTPGGIPGLDLVKDGDGDENHDDNPKECTVIEDNQPNPNQAPSKGPDLDAISKGINSILGDPKLLNMLSMVSQTQTAGAATPVNIQANMLHVPPGPPPSIQNKTQPNLPSLLNMSVGRPNLQEMPPKRQSFERPDIDEYSQHSYKPGQVEAVNNFDDQTRMSFSNGPNELDVGYGNNMRMDRNDSFRRFPDNRNGGFGGNDWRSNSFGGPNNFRNSNGPGSNRDNNMPFNRDNDEPFNRNNSGSFSRVNDRPFNRNNSGSFNRDNEGSFVRNNSGQYNRDNDLPFNRNNTGSFNRDNDGPFNRNKGGSFNRNSSFSRDDNYGDSYGEMSNERFNDGYDEEQQYNEDYNEDDYDKYHNMFNEDQQHSQGGEEGVNHLNQQPIMDELAPEPEPEPVDDVPLFVPEIVVDYEHKSAKEPEPEVALSVIRMFDYRHKPVNRIPYPQRPVWLSSSLRNIKQFDPLGTTRFAASDLSFERDTTRYPDVEPPSRFIERDSKYSNELPRNRYENDLPVDKYSNNRHPDSKIGRGGFDRSRGRYDGYFNRNRGRDEFERDRERPGDFDKRNKGKGGGFNRPSDRDRRSNVAEEKDLATKKLELEELSDDDEDFEDSKSKNSKPGLRFSPPPKKSDDDDEVQFVPLANSVNTSVNPVNSKPIVQIVTIEDLICSPGRLTRPQRIVIILRGPPGSGKTYLAKLIKDKEVENGGSAPRILSLDDYFMVEHEKEVVEDGKRLRVKEMTYEYEAEMEESYRQSLIKSFKKTITDGYFSFVIVDNVNQKVKNFGEMWSFAKQNGFQVYICQMDLDPELCTSRNIHQRTESFIEDCIAGWEPTPAHHPLVDATNFLQSQSITEVEMELDNNEPEETQEAGEEHDSTASANHFAPPQQWQNTSNWTTSGRNQPNHRNQGRRGFGGPTWKNRNNRRR
ncbi:YLP motif-containing protein 1-like isoform X2 [Anthonomus grandis grandis]|uniref:YLP motif-containing protein 1-like isoform X2 n=1 Tax=Anthonomus grandis grandis TaxID=2921223 RepID=UPI0021668AC3|nr:YLP motif-containing protein 1-like isoform X2 [Anthonomus grandis grandis]